MWPARTKSSGIGLALGLAPDAFDAIEKSHNYRVDDVFSEMMKECLRQGLVTQQKLADAVSSRQVSFGYLSEEILAAEFTISKTARRKLIFMIKFYADYYYYYFNSATTSSTCNNSWCGCVHACSRRRWSATVLCMVECILYACITLTVWCV